MQAALPVLMVKLIPMHQGERLRILIRGTQILFRQLKLPPGFYPEHILYVLLMLMDVLPVARLRLIHLAAP